ncbi:hypothetical protein [Methanosphaerula palustris]|uniref:SatD n=1 Tax=Methanosphaerula palustris (strain ATCC BAA-1556 / DSM 19958 / E1-9c) TaxID=521011 RepID=B8GJU4_METPE|nr:hypothetical protein [Methanosphaerula palustris]ACL15748.1 hypothetical protein Mpal_0371 [Methanosphaerula palustris E1-9c]
MGTEIVAVLTGDLVKSQTYLTEALTSTLADLRSGFKTFKEIMGEAHNQSNFDLMISRGDSFQGLLLQPEIALKAAIYIRADLIRDSKAKFRRDARIAIGIGTVEDMDASLGEAFIKSGVWLDELKDMKQNLIIRTSFGDEINREFDTECALTDGIIQKWTSGQAEAVKEYVISENQEEVAKKLGISQAAVSLRLNGSNYSLLQKFFSRYQEIISREIQKQTEITTNNRSENLDLAAKRIAEVMWNLGYRHLSDAELNSLSKNDALSRKVEARLKQYQGSAQK